MSCDMDHFMAMEELGQISIFDMLNNLQHRFSVGDDVRVTITLESDRESYNYLEGYCPGALKNSGEIVEVLANNLYLVSFKGTINIFKDSEIEKNK